MSLRVDLSWMIRTGRATPGRRTSGQLSWDCGGEPAGSIGYEADMLDPNACQLILSFSRGSGDRRENVHQVVRLVATRPNYGGRRWWMICPFSSRRVAKLYLPPGGDRFASRNAWRLGYHSQRVSAADQPFEALFRFQKRLGGSQGWGAGLPRRPKGMWRRTYERLWDEYEQLERGCDRAMNDFLVRRTGGGP